MTRKMWVDPNWMDDPDRICFEAWDSKGHHHTRPVLVTDAEGMPDFKPGDRVRGPSGDEFDVEAVYRDCRHGDWCVAAYRANSTIAVLLSSATLTLPPRETSKLVRVTGPEAEIVTTIECIKRQESQSRGVRVEIVEEGE